MNGDMRFNSALIMATGWARYFKMKYGFAKMKTLLLIYFTIDAQFFRKVTEEKRGGKVFMPKDAILSSCSQIANISSLSKSKVLGVLDVLQLEGLINFKVLSRKTKRSMRYTGLRIQRLPINTPPVTESYDVHEGTEQPADQDMRSTMVELIREQRGESFSEQEWNHLIKKEIAEIAGDHVSLQDLCEQDLYRLHKRLCEVCEGTGCPS